MNVELNENSSDSRIAKIPRLILLAGYLGGEKLRLLHQFVDLLKKPSRYIAVIENHRNRANRFHDSIECDYLITEITESMIQCKLIGDLKTTVIDILKVYQADFIVFECLESLDMPLFYQQLIEIKQLIRYDSLTTVIDCLTAEKILEENDDAQNQIKAADILLVAQKELLNEIRLQHLVQMIREQNPFAPIISMDTNSFNPMLLYGINLLKFRETPKKGMHQGEKERVEDICDHLSADRITIKDIITKEAFLEQLQEIPKNILRVEGILRFSEETCPVHFQFVSGRYEFQKYPFPDFKTQYLVATGKNLEGFRFKF